jgi:hypothetical protein
VTECRAFVDVAARIIRSAVREDVPHRGQTCALFGVKTLGSNDPGNAAHQATS